ncbi:MAG: hypothetical protein ACXV8O_15640 [Methylobacter sp.]
MIPPPRYRERFSDAKRQGSARIKLFFKNQFVIKMHIAMFDGLYNSFAVDKEALAINGAKRLYACRPAAAVFLGLMPRPH